MAEGPKTGVAAGAARAIHAADASPPIRRATQLPLAIAGDDAGANDPVGVELETARRQGRPPGSPNKASVAWQEYLLRRYRSPLEGLAQIAMRPTDELAWELACKRREALAMQIDAMKVLLPYMHQKLPVEVDVSQIQRFVLVIEDAESAGGRDGGTFAGLELPGAFLEAEPGDVTGAEPEEKSEQNQQLDAPRSGESDSPESDDDE